MIVKKTSISFCLSIFALAAALPLFAAENKSVPSETTIWFDAPVKNFTESSPLGNGRLGAMMFGGVDDERIVLNESSVWSGSRQDADRPDAYKVLPEIQKLLLAGKNPEAEALVNANFTCKGPGSGGGQYGCYQVLGNLHLSFLPGDTNLPVTNYRRKLNLNDAMATVEFNRGGVKFDREMFSSAPDQVMVLRLSADKPGQISFDAQLDRPERFGTTGDGDNGLLMTGQLDNGTDGKGVKYVARIRVLNRGGKVFVHENVLSVSNADEVVLLIAAGTDYQGFAGRQTKDPWLATLSDLNLAAKKSFKSLREAHVADYQKYFQRVSLQLEPLDAVAAEKPINERLKTAENSPGDPSLAALHFNFGRYLLISSLQEPGAKTAHDYYAARGWVAHVIANPWGFTSPGEGASWGATTGGSAWLCQHLWDHYLFTRDKNFLQWAYPIMKGSARFYADLLIEEPKHHWLVIAPANSPENGFRMADGRTAAVCMGPTVMQQMVRYLFGACIESSKILGVDGDFRNELIAKTARLAPNQIGSDGRLMEWLEQYQEPEPQHRHVSHLWGLYPGDEISPATPPDMAQAARKTLEARGDDGVGWSLAYKAALWTRLGDGNHAWLLTRKALFPVTSQEKRLAREQ